MNCEKYEEPIALYIEGDLEPREALQVEAHIAQCRACSLFVEELAESQNALKAFRAEDFDEALLNNVRRSVMAQISVKPEAGFWQRLFGAFDWRYATAFALIAALAGSVYLLRSPQAVRQPTTASVSQKKEHIEPQKSNEGVKEAAPNATAKIDKPSRKIRRAAVRKGIEDMTAKVKIPPIRSMEPPVFTGATFVPEIYKAPLMKTALGEIKAPSLPIAEEEKMKLEIRTSDPNIRIIWFVNKPADKTNTRSST